MKLSYLERPNFCNPINGIAGLYLQVLASERTNEAKLLEFVRNDVEKAGYNPDGRAMVGMPCEYGVLSRSYALWFYEKRGKR